MPPEGLQRPGDCNQDGVFDISDLICRLIFLFLSRPATLPCEESGTTRLFDHNDDGRRSKSTAAKFRELEVHDSWLLPERRSVDHVIVFRTGLW